MPVITVEMLQGRTVEQKRQLVKTITDAMVNIAKSPLDAVHVVIYEVPKENWGSAGVLHSDK